MSIRKLLLNRTACLSSLLAAFALLLGLAPVAHAAAGNNNIKIIAYYGAGDLSKSEYARDTIILFNPTDHAITMNNWSIQSGGTGGSFTSVTYKLPVATIPSGGYYAITGSSPNYGVGNCKATAHDCYLNYNFDYRLLHIEGQDCDDQNVPYSTCTTAQNSLSSTGATLALVDNQVPLGSGCPKTAPDLVDMISVAAADGSALNTCWLGGGTAPYTPTSVNGTATNIHGLTYAYATIRKNKCVDTGDNSNDYTLSYIDYENSSSPATPCPTGTQLTVDTAVATPNNPALNTPFLITSHVTPSAGATITSVTADLSNLGLSTTTPLYDDGTHGDVTAGDGIYSTTATAISGTANVTLGLIITAKDSKNQTALNSIAFRLGGGNYPGPGNNNIRIIAWYGAGNLTSSEYARDTVILFNPTDHSITMNNWSLQTANNLGAFSSVSYKLPPTITIPSGGYYAITGSGVNYGSGCVTDHCNLKYPFDYQLKTVEGTATDADNDLSSTQVVVALVDNQTALGSDCAKNSAHVVDFVGIGAVAPAADGSNAVYCYAGSGYAPYTNTAATGFTGTSNGVVYAYATVRKNKCVNTFDNANDWTLGYIDYENSASKPEPCPGGAPEQQLTVTGASNPSSFGVTDPVTFIATVHPSVGATVSGVVGDLSNLGLSATETFYDDGTHGDAKAGDNIYSLAATPKAGTAGIAIGVNVTATDSASNVATASIPVQILSGTISLTSTSYTASEKAGDVANFPLTIKSLHGYNGILEFTCTGTPNNGANPVPTKTQCVITPPTISVSPAGTVTVALNIATGTTKSASAISRSLPLGLLGFLSTMVLAVAIWRRKHLPVACLLALACFLSLHTTGCETNAGLKDTGATPGTYTYTLTATDHDSGNVMSTTTFTVTVQ